MCAQNQFLNYTDKNKWTRMLHLVNANAQLLQPNIEQQFKKLAFIRLLFNNLLLCLIQYSGLNLSNLSSSPSPVWFATGTACAFLFLRGYSVLPGIWLGNFLAYFFAKVGVGLAIAFATVISLQAVILLWFSYRYLSPTLIFYKLPMYLQFIIFTAALTATTSLTLLLLFALSMPHKEILRLEWISLWLGNLNAILIFSCAYVTWDAYFSLAYTITTPHKLIRNTLYALVVCISVALALSTTQATTCILALASLWVTVAISVGFGWCGAMTATFLSAILLSLAAFEETPAFHSPLTSSTIIFLQCFLCVQTIIGLSIAIQRKKHW